MADTFHSFLSRSLVKIFGALSPESRSTIASYFDRVSLPSGSPLYRRGDPGDSMHVVVTGRLSVRIPTPSGGEREVRHLATGDPLGEIALLTGQPRTADVVAIRDTILGRLTKEAFDDLVAELPDAVLDMARSTIRMLTEAEVGAATAPAMRNIALVSLDPEFPLAEFGRRLELALLRFGSTKYFDSRRVRQLLDLPGDDVDRLDPNSEPLGRLLDEAENSRRFVIYQTDTELTPWSRKCLSQADRILLLADSSSSPQPRALEERIRAGAGDALLAEQDLVLVHFDAGKSPSGTTSWLDPRTVDRHYHVPWQGESGVERLARMLADRAVTLVLGAGGARGFAHIGVVRAIREAGIPIDAVGGSSIGSIVATTVALDWSDEEILFNVKKAFVDEQPMNDYTFPMFALLRGRKLSRALVRYLGDVDIVDTWLPFFCVSGNLSSSSAFTHRSGTLWKAIQSSVSLPAILPPFVNDGQLHVDGATLNHLPVDIMKQWVAGRLIAVDPSVHKEYTLERDVAPTPLGYIGEQLFGRSKGGFPGISSLILKSTILGGSSALSTAREQADLYLNPPLGEFGLLDWGRFHDVVDAGYRYAHDEIAGWIETNPDVVQRDARLGLRSARAAG